VQDYLHAERCWQQRRAGISEPFTFQDLRKTCSTWLGRVDRELRRLVLGHASRDVNDEYYFSGIGTVRDKLPLVPMPQAFNLIFAEKGDRQRLLFD
jgi:integrase